MLGERGAVSGDVALMRTWQQGLTISVWEQGQLGPGLRSRGNVAGPGPRRDVPAGTCSGEDWMQGGA